MDDITHSQFNVDVQIVRVEGANIAPLAPFAVQNAETATEQLAL